MILLSMHQLSASVAERPRRSAAITLLVLVAALCWQRSISKRRAACDATKVAADFAPAAAMLLQREAVDGARSFPRPSDTRLDIPPDGSPSPHRAVVKVRALFISDVHLGTPGCQADPLVDFFRSHEAETLFLVGDIVDGWRLKSNWYWPKAHTDVLQ
jgi:hypothetical protein